MRFLDGPDEDFTVSSSQDQRDLLRRLVVDEGRDVIEFESIGGGLEELFLTITEGKVQ